MCTITVIYHSTYGHTKLQAEAVLRGVTSVQGVQGSLLTADEAAHKLNDLDGSDAIIFGCPTYMGSMSAGMKTFLEAASQKWHSSAWKDKLAGAFTNSMSFSGDKLNTLVGLFINAMQHGMIFVGLGLKPSANRPEQLNSLAGPGPEAHNRAGSFIGPMSASFQVSIPDSPGIGDIETAELYGQRVAQLTLQFTRGRADVRQV